jgi:ArsR family transcriptional regulator
MQSFVRVMKALSDPNRVTLVKLLQVRSLCVCELRAALSISQPSVSKHLKILEEAGLVTSSKEGLYVNYRLADGAANPYAATLLGSLRHWLDQDPKVADLKARVPHLDRERLCAMMSVEAVNS